MRINLKILFGCLPILLAACDPEPKPQYTYQVNNEVGVAINLTCQGQTTVNVPAKSTAFFSTPLPFSNYEIHPEISVAPKLIEYKEDPPYVITITAK